MTVAAKASPAVEAAASTLADIAAVTAAVGGIISSLVWPIFALVVVLTFKDSIKAMFGRLKSVDALGVKADLKDIETKTEVLEAISDARHQPALEGNPVLGEPRQPDEDNFFQQNDKKFEKLVGVHPDSAVVTDWVEIEAQLRELAHPALGPSLYRRPISVIVRALGEAGLLPPSLVEIVQDMSKVKNDILHNRATLTAEEARQFHRSANVVLGEIAFANALGSHHSQLNEGVPQI